MFNVRAEAIANNWSVKLDLLLQGYLILEETLEAVGQKVVVSVNHVHLELAHLIVEDHSASREWSLIIEGITLRQVLILQYIPSTA
jgi:hypothetical protein